MMSGILTPRRLRPIILLCFFLVVTAVTAQNSETKIFKRTLRVGIAGNAPFVISPEMNAGISPEIWEALAAKRKWAYTTQKYSDVSSALAALDSGKIDVLVGPVSITSEREKQFRFSQPYYQSGLSILSRTEDPTIWDRVKPIFSWQFFVAVGVLVFILGIVGLLIWLAERRKNSEQFDPRFPKGVGDGMWCAIVTMTTTGYGDKSPVTFQGRLVAASWMIISIIFATTMIAGISSTLTLSWLSDNTVANAKQLRTRKVATIQSDQSDRLLARYGAVNIPTQSLPEAYHLLKTKAVSAVVFDRPQLLYFLQEQGDKDVTISDSEYARRGYGFALAADSDLAHEVSVSLLELQESGRAGRIIKEWVEDEN